MDPSDEIPIACVMDAVAPAERPRYRELRRELIDVTTAADLPDGYDLRLQRDAAVLARAAEWIEMERRCCPFLDFELIWPAAGAPRMRLRGRPGVKEFLELEFGLRRG